MTPELLKITDRLDVARPYVWRMRLTADEFDELEAYLYALDAKEKAAPGRVLSRLVIVYLAEWYHRCYCGAENAQANAVQDVDLKKVWEASGINADKYVYTSDAGNRLWKYSIYVLGGLGARHELNRGDNGRFVKALCRMLHGENYTLENLDDAGRAVAFRQSIQKKHSLYEYLAWILNGGGESGDEATARLVAAIRKANDEVLRCKFALEWIVTNSPSSPYMTRWLRLWLKPEEVGGGLHQYLRYDRLRLWGVAHPEQMPSIYFGLRWKNGGHTVKELDKGKSLLTYSNTGNDFVFWSAEDRYAICKDVPACAFTKIEIVAFDGLGNEWITQTEDATGWLQLWRMDDGNHRWSSRQGAQQQTAVAYTDDWQAGAEADARKPFVDKAHGVGTEWNWAYILSDITLRNRSGDSVTLYNRNGYDQVYTLLHRDTIHYADGGLVKYMEEDEEEGAIDEYYPLIFHKEDIRMRHFATRDAIAEARVESDGVCQEVEYKEGGRFLPWTEESQPAYGLVDLRVTEKGVAHRLTVAYLGEICRDFAAGAIHYRQPDGTEATCQDHIVCDGRHPLQPTVALSIGNFEIEVYRPTLVKELYLDGRLHRYVADGEEFVLPYILKDRVRIADFSRQGYRLYDCSHIGSVFSTFAAGGDNVELTWLKEYKSMPATALDANAPLWLRVALAKPSAALQHKLMKWNPDTEPEPQPIIYEEGYKKQRGETFFMDMRYPDTDMSLHYVEPAPPSPFAKGKKLAGVELRCFEAAKLYQAYFGQFRSLRLVAHKGQTAEKLIAPLREARGGMLTEGDIKELIRFADEFRLDTNNLLIND